VQQWLQEGTSVLRYTYSTLHVFFYFVYMFTKPIDFFSAVSLNFASQRSFSCLFHCPLHFPFLLSILLILGLHGRRSVRCVGFSGRTTHNKHLPTFRKMVQMLSAGWMNLGSHTVLLAEGVFESNKSDLYPSAHRQPPNLHTGSTTNSD